MTASSSLRRKEATVVQRAIVKDLNEAVDDARSAIESSQRALRRNDCHGAFSAFIAGAQQVGVAEGIARFLPEKVARKAAKQADVAGLISEFASTHRRLERCVLPATKKVRGFARTTGQMYSRRSR